MHIVHHEQQKQDFLYGSQKKHSDIPRWGGRFFSGKIWCSDKTDQQYQRWSLIDDFGIWR